MRVLRATLVAAILALADFTAGTSTPPSAPLVDVGYARYQGFFNTSSGLNTWKSIRYAAPPTGKLRWQAPQPPPVNKKDITSAVTQPPVCPQTGAFGTPAVYGFNSGPGNEDCLYLNVYAAPGAKKLPVFLWIHGGGYSDFGAVYDPSVLINTNDNGFVVVEIQYRLGAFGFLASPEVKDGGKLNAGLLDMQFALKWVQEHIAAFGGDPDKVTLGGESSGAGSVLYLSMANSGKGSNLFNNLIAVSPYVPAIYNYSDPEPVANFDDFAKLAGCDDNAVKQHGYRSKFQCLVAADTDVLQKASGTVSTTRGYFGTFAFLPVIDGDFIPAAPSKYLSGGTLKGKRLLLGNNANEGVPLSDPTIRDRAHFDAWVKTAFSRFSNADIAKLNDVYHVSSAQPGDNAVRFDTLGDSGPTALTQSGYATGIQQAAFNIFGESTFDCPGYWMAEAFSNCGRVAWKYQYSVEPNHHGADLSAYWSVGATVPDAGFRHAFQKIWGNFIIHNDPTISVKDATAGRSNATVPTEKGGRNIQWPRYTPSHPQQLDLNTTGGDVTLITVTDDLSYNVRTGAGVVNTFRLVDASKWEGGRGSRCSFWRGVASNVPY